MLTIGLNRAVTVIAESPKRSSRAKALKTLGDHPDDGKPIEIFEGRYGPYVKHGKINASLPKSMSEESITLEEALELIAQRAAKGAKKKKASAKKKKASAKKKPRAKSAGKAKVPEPTA